MDFIEKIKQFKGRAGELKDKLETEEATKTALIMPIIQILGYDVFNPLEFTPEFTADIGNKKGEKVDYAIIKDGKPVILIEAKGVNDKLTNHDDQLFRYFTATEAKFAVLTNGIDYKFFTDLEETNKMDDKPFLEINLLESDDSKLQELKKFSKSNFDINTIFTAASELKYTNLIKTQLNNQLQNPSDEFIKFIISDFYKGLKTQNVIDKFRPIVKKSMQHFVSDFMNERIKSILEANETQKDEESSNEVESKSKIETTEEELQGFNIVKSILTEVVDPEDIQYKDSESYFAIIYKNNIRKWICRLYFDSSKKSIVVQKEGKERERLYIDQLNDIYKYKINLLESLSIHTDISRTNEN